MDEADIPPFEPTSEQTTLPAIGGVVQALPDPQVIRELESLSPGASNTLLNMVKEESAHRRSKEDRAQEMEHQRNRQHHLRRVLAMVCGVTIGITALIICGLVLMNTDHWTAQIGSAILGGSGVYGLIHVFKQWEN